MKKKIVLVAIVVVSGIYSAIACSYSECKGGNVKCCTDFFGATYYAKGTGE